MTDTWLMEAVKTYLAALDDANRIRDDLRSTRMQRELQQATLRKAEQRLRLAVMTMAANE